MGNPISVSQATGLGHTVVALLYIENKRFALDTLRVANRSPTQASKINDVPGQSDDIWGGPGPPFPADFGGSRGPGRLNKHEAATTHTGGRPYG